MQKWLPQFYFSQVDLEGESPAFDVIRQAKSSTRNLRGGRFTQRIEFADEIPVARFSILAEDWLADCQSRYHSPRTIVARRCYLNSLKWFLDHKGYESCGTREMRQFFAYLVSGHSAEGERWKGKNARSWTKPLRPVTVLTYYHHLGAFFHWLVGEELLEVSPMDRVGRPVYREEQIEPFTRDQIRLLIETARRYPNATRNELLIRIPYSSGIRVSEMVNLRLGDVDFSGPRIRVLGKGNKHRTIVFGRKVARLLWKYLDEEPHGNEEEWLLWSGRGINTRLTRQSVGKIIHRLGARAGLKGVRCSPHTLRHSFGTEFSRTGGQPYALKEILGHTTLATTNKYVKLAQTDVENVHRHNCPDDRLDY